jgi:tRNA-Thr(GGU) m(6)t(6)A37 methyltransferase TsaA
LTGSSYNAVRQCCCLIRCPRHGVFATRAPTRPNRIGLSVVELVKVDGRLLSLSNVDILDGTPVLDIKPYVPDFDAPRDARIGWLEQARTRGRSTKSDDRFSGPVSIS